MGVKGAVKGVPGPSHPYPSHVKGATLHVKGPPFTLRLSPQGCCGSLVAAERPVSGFQ